MCEWGHMRHGYSTEIVLYPWHPTLDSKSLSEFGWGGFDGGVGGVGAVGF